jgi:hypothetical protein
MSRINDAGLSLSGAKSMKTWKKSFRPIGFAIVVVCFLIGGLEEWVIDGGPIHYKSLGIAFLFFVVGVVFFVWDRKSGGGDGPPNA